MNFLLVVDKLGQKKYINEKYIVSIRPVDRKSFRDSGASVEVFEGSETNVYFTEPGENTDTVTTWLGLR